MPAVLFVCRANQFRSPVAAACLKQIVQQDYPDEQWVIGSAGTWTPEGLVAPAVTLEAARWLELAGMEKHVTRQVNAKLLSQADLVVVMESGQEEALRYEFPLAAGHIYQISEIVDQMAYDIRDPDVAEGNAMEVSQALCQLVSRGSGKILELARKLQRERSTDF